MSLLVSGLTVLTAVALLPLLRDLPQAVLGAIVIAAVIGFLNVPALRRIARPRRDSFVLALLALAGVLVLGVLGLLLLGRGHLGRAAHGLPEPPRQHRPDRARAAGVPAGRAAAVPQRQAGPDRVRELLAAAPEPVRATVHERLRRGGLAAPSASTGCTATWPTPPPTSAPPWTPDRGQRDGWVRAKNSSALRVLGSWGPVALRPWPCTNLTAPAYTSSTFWGVALVDTSTSGIWPG